MGEATPTDPRAQRNRAGRRGGHLTTRALSPARNTGLPTTASLPAPLSRTVAPYADPGSPTRGDLSTEPAAPPPFIPGNNPVEADHGRLKARLGPMRGLKTLRSLRTVAAGHAFVQNLRRGHYEITADLPVHDRVRLAFTDLARCV